MAIDLISYLRSNPFILAPMAGITDSCFRSFMRELGCGVVVTELVSAHGIEYKSHRTAQLMGYEEIQRPVGIQLFGETPEVLAAGAKVVEDAGADFVDLNFGCPVPKVVKKGAGSAILKDLPQVERVFRAVKAATRLPVTVKIRTGWDEPSRNAEKVAEIAYNEGLTWVAIHGRTRAAGYSGLADWDYIAEVKAKSRIPIIGNGDINSAETAIRRMKETGCEGVMIGRGCLKNPWIFKEAMDLWSQEQSQERASGSRIERVGADAGESRDKSYDESKVIALEEAILSSDSSNLVAAVATQQGGRFSGAGAINTMPGAPSREAYEKDFPELFRRLHLAFEKATDQRITMLQIKKFASWYSSGYPGASNFRKAIFQTQTVEETMAMTLEFFSNLRTVAQADTSQEAFLMGGHG